MEKKFYDFWVFFTPVLFYSGSRRDITQDLGNLKTVFLLTLETIYSKINYILAVTVPVAARYKMMLLSIIYADICRIILKICAGSTSRQRDICCLIVSLYKPEFFLQQFMRLSALYI